MRRCRAARRHNPIRIVGEGEWVCFAAIAVSRGGGLPRRIRGGWSYGGGKAQREGGQDHVEAVPVSHSGTGCPSATPLIFVIGFKSVAAGSSVIGVGGPAGCSEVKMCPETVMPIGAEPPDERWCADRVDRGAKRASAPRG